MFHCYFIYLLARVHDSGYFLTCKQLTRYSKDREEVVGCVCVCVKISFIFYSKVFVFSFVFIKSKFFSRKHSKFCNDSILSFSKLPPKNSPGQPVPLTLTVLEPQAPLTTTHTHTLSSFHPQFQNSWAVVDLVSLTRALNFMTQFNCLVYLSVFFPRWQVFWW